MNSNNIAVAVVVFIADSVNIYGCMPYGIHTDDTVAIHKYII